MPREKKARPLSTAVTRTLYKTGGVLAVGIPALFAKELRWQAGDEVRVECHGMEIRVWKPVISHPGRQGDESV